MLGIVLIDYDSQERTTQYISDVLLSSDLPIEYIVVVDNTAGTQNYMQMVESLKKISFVTVSDTVDMDEAAVDLQTVGMINETKIYLLHSVENLGFARANNLGFRVLRALDKIDYILFSNSDILFENNFAGISELVEKISKQDKAFMIGPRVIYPDGRLQSPCRYVSIYNRWWRNSLLWPVKTSLTKDKRELIEDAPEGAVYRIIGAFMLVDADKFEEIGGFDEHTFLYAEELILAERGKKYRYDVLYTPNVQIIHENGYTTQRKRTPASRDFKLRAMVESDLYYYENYIGVSKAIIKITKIVFSFYIFKLHLKDVIVRIIGGRK